MSLETCLERMTHFLFKHAYNLWTDFFKIIILLQMPVNLLSRKADMSSLLLEAQ